MKQAYRKPQIINPKSHTPSPVSNLLSSVTLVLFIYMPFHIFLSQWLSTYTGGLSIWKVWKDILTGLLLIAAFSLVFMYKRQTRLYLWIFGLGVLYGLIHLMLYLVTDQPLETALLGTTYNLRILAYLLIGYSLALLNINRDTALSSVSVRSGSSERVVLKYDEVSTGANKPKMSKKQAESLATPESRFAGAEFLAVRYMRILIIISTIVCIVGLLQWFLPKDILEHFGYSIQRGVKPNFFIDDKPDLPRLFSTLRDPNSLGAFLILPITFLVYKLKQHWKTEKRMLILGLLVLHIWVLLLTFSRSTLLATLLAVGSLLIIQSRAIVMQHKHKLALYVAAVLVITFGLVYVFRDQYFVQNTVFHADETTTLDSPNELRVGLAEKAVDGIIEQPLGHGPGTAGIVSTRLNGGLLTENYYLQILYEVGIFGVALFVALLTIICKNLWARRDYPLVQVLLASFVGLLFANLLFHTWSNEAVAISWFLLAGLCLSYKQRDVIIKRSRK